MNITFFMYSMALYMLAGCFTGFLSGLFGLGGGIIVVPALLSIFHLTHAIPDALCMHFAVGTSLAIMLWTALASIHAHTKQGAILWPVFFRLIKGVIIGVIIGGIVANFISTEVLKLIFGIFLILISWKIIHSIHQTHAHGFPRPLIHHLVSFAIGFKSGLLGVGGGALIIPYLTWCGVDIRKIASISAACTLIVSLFGSLVFSLTGLETNQHIPFTIGHIYWPAVLFMAIPSMLTARIGARLNYKLPVKQLRIIFAVILFITGVNMVYQ